MPWDNLYCIYQVLVLFVVSFLFPQSKFLYISGPCFVWCLFSFPAIFLQIIDMNNRTISLLVTRSCIEHDRNMQQACSGPLVSVKAKKIFQVIFLCLIWADREGSCCLERSSFNSMISSIGICLQLSIVNLMVFDCI